MIKKYIDKDGILARKDFNKEFSFLSKDKQQEIIEALSYNNIKVTEKISSNNKTGNEMSNNYNCSICVAIKPEEIKLTNEQLCLMYQKGNRRALALLTIKNDRLVSKCAYKYLKFYNHKLEFEDLKQAGFSGMIKAVERFDISMENKFTTYAVYWIDRFIITSIMNEGFSIRLPVHIFEKVGKVAKIITTSNFVSEEDLKDYICKELQYIKEEVEELIFYYKYLIKPISLDLPIGEDEDTLMVDMLSAEEKKLQETVEEAVEKKVLKELINNILDTLTEREEKVIRLRFGLNDGRERTLEEIGQEFGVTRERIRQIEAKALTKLRHPSRSRKIVNFYKEGDCNDKLNKK